METIASATIGRHGVPLDRNGLSPMQAALLVTTAPCALGIGPTGTGKSYVTRRQFAAGERILYVSPTIALAKNQAHAFREEVARETADKGRMEAGDTERRIRIFNAEEMNRAVAEGSTRTLEGLRRRNDLQKQDMFRDNGEIILTTPEALSSILMRPIPGAQADMGPATVIRSFDRVVFDEFHLIPPRGFGLVSLVAGLAVNGPWAGENGYGRAKTSLLSATPVDVTAVMAKLGVPMVPGCVISETVVDIPGEAADHRILHGDVEIRFVEAESHLEILESLDGYIGAMNPEWGVTCIYDSLAHHGKYAPGMKAFFLRHGSEADIHFSSSLARQQKGTDQVLEGKRFVLATSTIEVGVTIKGLHLCVMDPGHSPSSCMQRIGRAARGDMPGLVVIRLDRNALSRTPWLAALVTMVSESGGRIGIAELSAFMSRAGRIGERFEISEKHLDEVSGEEASPPYEAFDKMSARAVFASGLYWKMVSDRIESSGQRQLAETIRAAAPPAMKSVSGMLRDIRRLKGGKTWEHAFLAAATQLRDFDTTVVVQGVGGQSFNVTEGWLHRATEILDRYPFTIDANGKPCVKVDAKGWDELIILNKKWQVRTRSAVLHNGAVALIAAKRAMESYSDVSDRAMAGYPPGDKLRARKATLLVRATGVIPYDESPNFGSSGTNSSIL